jgi:anaerobic selenocysteine-containing dehydrogenase
MTKSRRQFLKLVAAGSAAALTGSSQRSLAATAVKAARRAARPAAPPPAPTAAARAEIRKQKEQTAEALKTIRDYPLPTGSPMAFVFQPLKAGRGRKGR